MKQLIITLFTIVLFVNFSYSQCVDCDSPCVTCDVTVPVIEVDLSSAIDTIWEGDGYDREGHCCGVSGGPSMDCIKFNITLNEYTEQLKFEMERPAPPSNASKYWINCADPMYNLGDSVCVVGLRTFCISYCKNGEDNPIYRFTAGRLTRASSDISLAAGCIDSIFVLGMQQSTINWTAVSSDPAKVELYNTYLSSRVNDSVLVTAPTPIPDGLNYVDYAVSGQSAGCSSGLSHDTVRVYFIANSLSVVITPDDPAICADGPGNIDITAVGAGGTPPYSYVWSTGATSSTLTVTTAMVTGNTDFWVEISDTSDCGVRRDTVNVAEFDLAITVAAGDDRIVCISDPSVELDGVIEVASGGTWTGGSDAGFVPDRNDLNAIYTLSADEIFNREVELTLTSTGNRGCPAATDKIKIFVEPLPTLSINKTDVLCNSGNNGAATVTISGGTAKYNYNWSNGSSTLNSDLASNTISSLIADTYCVTVTDSVLCSVSKCTTLTEPAVLTSSISAQTNVKCKGASTGSASVLAAGGAGGYTYNWNSSPAQTTQTASSLPAGTYTVTVTDINGCTVTSGVTITEPASLLSSSITAQTNVMCKGNPTGSATVTAAGGAGGYSYNWNSTPAQSTQTATSLPAGTYTVTVTDINLCTSTVGATITEPAAVLSASITAQTNVKCKGNSTGSATVTAAGGAGGYSYNWNSTPAQATQTATSLPAGTYSVTITDANLCTTTVGATITEPAVVLSSSITAQTNVKCKGASTGSATVTAAGGAGGFSYNWNSAPAQATQTATSLPAGTYTVTVTDANLCTTTVGATITEPAVVLSASITAQTNVKCKGNSTGSATVTAAGGAGGYSYNWNSTPAQATQTATGLPAGTYSVTVTDANLCTTIVGATITEPAVVLSASITAQTNVKCKGASTGSATVTAAGGAGGYSYNWNSAPAQATQTATSLPAGTYTVTVTDANLCTATVGATITEPAVVLSASITAQTNVMCKGNSTGVATVTAAGGAGGYSYNWNSTPAQSTQTATSLPAGTYTVTITDANLCTTTVGATITEPAVILSASITAQTNVVCKGLSTGSATVTAAGGAGGYSYNWNSTPAQSTQTATSLPAGTYTVTVTDANSCTKTVGATITEPAVVLNSSITAQTNVSCNAGSNGSATVTPVGGVSPYTYNWNSIPAQTTQTASNLPAGTYSVTVTDANGCNNSVSSATITEPAVLTASITAQTNVSCNTGSNGNATVTATGGTTPYSYLWTGGQTVNPAVNLFAGTYTVTVTDSKGCTQTTAATITEPAVLTSSITAQTNVNCNGASTGSATVTAGGGTTPYSYLWTGGQTVNPAVNLTAGTYTVTVTDANSCTKSVSATITQPAAMTATISAQTNVSCNAGNNGNATVTAGGGTTPYTYLWTGGQTVNPAINLTAGTYTVTVTDNNGCTKTTSATITEPTVLTTSISVQTNVSCNGGSNGSATVLVGGGTPSYTYLWTGGQTVNPAVNLAAGTYTVTVTDNKGCTKTTSATITEPAVLTASITAQTNVLCNSAATGSATVTAGGGTTPYSYLWTGGQTSNSAINLTAGTYTVTVTDNKGCTKTTSATITQPTVLTASISAQTNVSCNAGSNGTAMVLAGGGTTPYSYLWTGGQTVNPAVNLIAGTYNVTVTDANSCTKTTSVTITQPTSMTASISAQTNVSCNAGNNGSATVTAGGGTSPYTYLWTGGQTVNPAINLTAGTYTVTVTDNKGCTKTTSATITQPAVLTASISSQTNVSCNSGSNGSANVLAGGGTSPYSYLWTGGQTVNPAINLTEGTYTVTVTDNKGCSTTTAATITEPSVLTASISSQTNVSCNSGNNGAITALPAGGTSPYTYLWTGGQTANPAVNLSAGTYTVTVTDNKGCTKTTSATITQPSILAASITAQTNASCNGGNNGSATVTAGGGTSPYTYLWTGDQTVNPAINLTAGTYTVTVTDANSCTKTASATITQPASMTASISAQTNISCNGGNNGSATVTAGGGTSPYTYLWTSGQIANPAINLVAGTYTVTVTDNKGCTKSTSATITEPAILTASISAQTNVGCNGASSGSSTVSVSGGTSPFNYLWTDGQTTNPSVNLSAGTYSVTVTDNKNCTSTTEVTITESDALVLTPSHTNASCGVANGEATIAVSGGTSPYSYSWSNGGSTSTISNILAGNYTVTVSDGYTCTATNTISVNNEGSPTASISAQVNVSCNAGNDGSATVSASGGTTPYTYLWSDGQTNDIATVLTAGIYSVTVTDANTCLSTTNVTITQPDVLSASITAQTNVSCNGGNNGSATVTASGGVLVYSYSWDSAPAQITQTATNLPAGVYNVTISQGGGCIATATASVTITEPVTLTSSITAQTNVSCNGGNDGQATVTASDGTSPYTYLWSDISSQTTETAISLTAGTFTVTITDNKGCTTTSEATITEPVALSSLITSQQNVSCFGGSDGQATVTASDGTTPYTYLWAGGQTTESANSFAAGEYTVTVTDSKSCTTTSSITITEPSILTALITDQTNVTCKGGNDGDATVTANGGTTPYAFLWTGGQTVNPAVNLSAGSYFVTVTDDNNCTATTSIDITEPNVILTTSITSQVNVSCNGGSDGSATVTANGGDAPYSYTWNTTPPQNLQTATGLSSGTYNVTVVDANGCNNSTSSVTITEPDILAPSISSQSDVDCNGASTGSATATASGGTSPYNYVWDGGQTINPAIGLSQGVYGVTVTDANNCTSTSSVTINEPTVLTSTITAQSDADCKGALTGNATVTAGGGTTPYSYLWSDNQTTALSSGLLAGEYTVTVSDANGCTATSSVTIAEPTAVNAAITAQTNVTCNGGNDGDATVTAGGGTSPYTYSWTGGQTVNPAINLSAGTYTVTVTDDHSCIATTTVTITEPVGMLNTSISSQVNVSCNGGSDGSATVSVNGGTFPYSYSWNTTPGQNNITATSLAAGVYNVTVTDANGCNNSTSSATITEPDVLSASISTQSNVSCNGASTGSATVIAGGGTTPYSYLWDDGQTVNPATGLAQGTYGVTVTDANNCTTTTSVTITEPTALTSSITASTSVTCNSGNNGDATVTANGGTTAYSYLWSDGQTVNPAVSLIAGNYSVTVTDANSCISISSITISEPAVITITKSKINVSCFGGSDGAINITVSGGISPYTYIWTDGETTEDISGKPTGINTVTVTDANGCTNINAANITQPLEPLTATASATDVSCNAGSNGTATATPAGGTAPYSYLWTDGETTQTITNKAIGNYDVTVTDSKGCTTNASVIITEPTALTASITAQTDILCSGGNNGSATVTEAGGTSPYLYSWTGGGSSATYSNIIAGIYIATVTDAHSCTATATVTISEPTTLTSSIISQTNVGCNNGTDGDATVEAAGGTTPYTYLWSDNQTLTTATNLSFGLYSVTVTDNNSCTSTVDVTITQATSLTASISAQSDVSCFGTSTGSASLTVSGGTTPYTYLWSDGQTNTTASNLIAGNYSVTVSDANGCNVLTTVTITEPVLLTASASSTDVTCNAGNDGSATADAAGGTFPYSYLWSNNETSQTVYNLTEGNYSITITDSKACETISSVTISEPIPMSPDAGLPQQVCSGTTITLAATGGEIYSWSDGIDQGLPFVILTTTNFYVTVTDSAGCSAIDSVLITTLELPTVDAGIDKSICPGSNVQIGGSPTASGGLSPYTYIWDNNSSLDFDTVSNPVANPIASETYVVTITDANGCSNSDSVQVNLTFLASVDAGSDATICEGTSYNLHGTYGGGASSITWTSSTGGTFDNDTLPTATYTPSSSDITTGSVTLTITTDDPPGQCEAIKDSLIITIIGKPTANAGVDSVICEGSLYNLSGSFGGSANAIVWTSNDGIFGDYTSTNTTYTPSQSDIFIGGVNIVLTTNDTSGYCAVAKDTMFLAINKLAIVTAGIDTSICQGQSYTLSGSYSGGTSSILWTTATGGTFDNDTLTNAKYTPSALDISNGFVVLTITSNNPAGPCDAASDSIKININPKATANAGPDKQICPNASCTISGASIGGSATSFYWTSSGSGTFDNDTILNTTYTPSIADINLGSVYLYLHTNNPPGVCNAVTDRMTLTISGFVTVVAEEDKVICANSNTVNVSGTVNGPVTTGVWSTSGTGTFASDTALSNYYIVSPEDTTAGQVVLYLYSEDNGICDQEKDSIVLTINPGIYINAGDDITVCANNSEVSLNGNVWGGTSTGRWSSNGSGSFIPNDSTLNATYIPSIEDTTAGEVTLYLLSTNNGLCDEYVDSLTITITPAPVANAGSDIYVCVNNPEIQLDGNVFGGSVNGVWTTNGTGIFAPNDSILNPTYSPTESDTLAGSLTFILTSFDNGSCLLSTDTVKAFFTPAPIVSAGNDVTICGNDSTQLTGLVIGGAGIGVWSLYNSTGQFVPNATTLNAYYKPSQSDITAGFATLILSSSNLQGCLVERDTVVISLTTSPTVNAGDTTTVCENNSIVQILGEISGISNTGSWSTTGDGIFLLTDTILENQYFPGSNDIANEYVSLVLTSTNNGNCPADVDTFFVNILPKPNVFAGNDKTVCKTQNAHLNGTVSGPTTTGSWTTLGDGSFSNSDILNPTYIPGTNDTASGFVYLVLTSTENLSCLEVTDTIKLTFIDLPYVNAGSDLSICNNNTEFDLTGIINSPTNTGQWISSGTGTFMPNDTAMNVTYISTPEDTLAGNISIILNATNTCAFSDTILINYSLSPLVEAGANRTICIDQTQVNLNGIVSGGATTGRWTTSGTGYFTPNDSTLNATYVRSAQDSLNAIFYLKLTATNVDNCNEVKDSLRVKITTIPVVEAGSDFTYCANNATIHLGGIITGGASTGNWTTSGTGTFSASSTDLNGYYNPSTADTAAGFVRLTLTSTDACMNISDSVLYTFTPAPYVNAGLDQSVCANNNTVNLYGYVNSTSNTAKWLSTGTGSFNPSNTALNGQYLPSSADISNHGCKLILLSTNNGMCFAERDTIDLQITPSPVVNAGTQQYVCKDATITLNGSVTGGATTGIWTTNGTGMFNPSNTDLHATYIPSPADTIAGILTFTLTSTNNGTCNEVSSAMVAIFTDRPTVDAGTDLTLCANNANVNLNGIVSGSSTTGIWTTSGIGTFLPSETDLEATFKPSVATLASGSTQVILTSTNSCEQRDTITLNFTTAPLVSAGSDQVFCVNNPQIQLNGSVTLGATTGIWTTSGTGQFIPNDSTFDAIYNPSPLDTLIGEINLTLSSTNHGDCNTVSDFMTVSFVDKPIVNAGVDQTICANTSVFFDGQIEGGINMGYWSTSGTGIFYPDSSDLYAYYKFSSQDTTNSQLPFVLSTPEFAGCISESDTMLVSITPAPHANAGTDTTVCANNAIIQLNGNVWGPTTSGKWYSSGNGQFLPNDSAMNATYIPGSEDEDAGYAFLTLFSTNNGDCVFARDTMQVTILPSPEPNAGNDLYVCNGDYVRINGSVGGSSGTGIWSTNGSGTITPNDSSLSIIYLPSAADTVNGNIYFVLTSTYTGLCNAEQDTAYVYFSPPPFVDAGTDRIVCANNAEIILNGVVSGSTTTGEWTTSGDGTFTPDSVSLGGNYIPGINDLSLGHVVLTLSSTYACRVQDSIYLTVTPAPQVNAGMDLIICNSQSSVDLTGSVIGGASTGAWSTTGSGTFTPNNESLLANYNISQQDSIDRTFMLILTSTNNGDCFAVSDTMKVTITTVPQITAGSDQVVCANVDAILEGNIIGGNNSVHWTTSGSGNFLPSDTARDASYIFSAADTTIGEVTLTIQSTNSCVSVLDDMYIEITPAPVLDIWVNSPACENNDAIQLFSSVSVAGGAIWSSATSGTFSPNDSVREPIYYMSNEDKLNGYISLVLTSIDNGTCNAVVDSFEISIIPKPDVNAGADQNVCFENLYVRLNGTVSGGSSSGIWTTNGSGYFVPDSTNLGAIYIPSDNDTVSSQNGIYFILTSTNNGACFEEADTMNVIWTEKPIVSAGENIDICVYEGNIQLSGTITGPNNSGVWSTSGTGTFTPDNTSLNATYIPSQEDIDNVDVVLTLTASQGCAPVSDEILLSLNSVSSVDFTSVETCNSLSVLFNNTTIVNAGPTYTWNWSFGDGSTSSDFNTNHTYGSFNNYTVELKATTDKNCVDSVQKTISIHNVEANFNANSKCLTDAVSFRDSSIIENDTIVNWYWDFGDGYSDDISNTSHLYNDIATYDVWLNITTVAGCKDSISHSIEIYPDPIAGFTMTPEKPYPYEEVSFIDNSIGATQWQWIFGDNTDTATIQMPLHTYFEMNTYPVTQIAINEYGCTDTSSVDFLVEGFVEPFIPSAFTPNNDGQNDVLRVRGGPFSSVEMQVYNSWGKLLFESFNQTDGWDGTYKGKQQPIGVYIYIVKVVTLDGTIHNRQGDVTILR